MICTKTRKAASKVPAPKMRGSVASESASSSSGATINVVSKPASVKLIGVPPKIVARKKNPNWGP